MRSETTYYAFDDTEFCSEEECLAYEKYVSEHMTAAEFYDDEMNLVDVQKDGTGNVYYIRIINAEKAPGLFSWLNDQYGFEYPQGEFEDGDVFSYDVRDYDSWINLINQKKFIEKVEAMFEKEGEKNG
jgi:hypothetical protein